MTSERLRSHDCLLRPECQGPGSSLGSLHQSLSATLHLRTAGSFLKGSLRGTSVCLVWGKGYFLWCTFLFKIKRNKEEKRMWVGPNHPCPWDAPREQVVFGLGRTASLPLDFRHLCVPADPSGWWTGRLRGKQGLFPNNYVTKI